jgi:hypothetical protein
MRHDYNEVAMRSSFVTRAGSAALVASLAPAAAWADHPGALRSAEMSPLSVALITGGLALATALLVVVIVMLLTRKGPAAGRADERAGE